MVRVVASASGLMLLVCALTARSDIQISNPSLNFTLSSQDGTVVAGYDRNTGERIFDDCNDLYEMENDNGSTKFRETEFRVISSQHSDSTATFRCAHPTVKVLLDKRYSLKGRILEKDVEVISDGTPPCFVRVWTEVNIAPAFREGGHYYIPYPHSNANVKADDIDNDTILYSSVYLPIHTLACSVSNPSRRLLAASYLYKLNDFFSSWSFATPIEPGMERFNPVATPAGWRHFVSLDYMKDKTSYTTNYTVLQGDTSQLIWQYFSLPERRKLENKATPQWIKDVKLAMFIYPHGGEVSLKDDFLKKLQDLSVRLGRGHIMPIFNYYGYMSGDYPIDSDKVLWLKGQVDKLHRMIDKVKIGTYMFPVSISSKSQTFQQHPDWAQRKKDGSYPVADYPGRYPAQLGRIDVRDSLTAAISSATSVLGVDFLYIDGGEGAFSLEDWGNHLVSQNRDVDAFHRGILEGIRKEKGNRALFLNSPAAYLADCSFIELGGGLWDRPDWQHLSDCLHYAKIGQRDSAWISHLYPHDLTKYFAYMLALALKPDRAPRTEEDFQSFYAKWPPYVNAVYEIKDSLLINADISPNWRLSPDAALDTFALRQSQTILITAINHSSQELRRTIQVDREQLSLSAHRPLFVWEHDMVEPDRVDTKGVSISQFRMLPKAEERIELDASFPYQLTKIFSISTLPVFVKSIEGENCQFRLSQTQGIETKGEFDSSKGDLHVENPFEVCQIMVWTPPEWQDTKSTLDDKEVEGGAIEEFGDRFLLLDVPFGSHRVHVEPSGNPSF